MTQVLFITNFVFNAFFYLTAITLNMVTILALRKPGAVKTLLLTLAVSDFGVGLLVQPL